MINEIFNMDCMNYLDKLQDRSVDLFVLDPPYMNVVKNDWDRQWKTIDEYKEWCEQWISKCAKKGKYSSTF